MKKVIISVSGGVADVEGNVHNLNVRIVDFDNDGEDQEYELTDEEMQDYGVVVYVTGGLQR